MTANQKMPGKLWRESFLTPYKPKTDPTVRFMNKVRKTDSCWLWTGAMGSDGYGSFQWRRQNFGAHRASWILFRGELSTEQQVLHKCDARFCVNPDHLFIGTNEENHQDKINKGRHPKGGECWNSYLPEFVEQVFAAEGTQAEIAKRFGVGTGTVSRIKARDHWYFRDENVTPAATSGVRS